RLESIHPGHDLAEIRAATGFEFDHAPAPAETIGPSEEELSLIRGRVREEGAETYPRFAASLAVASGYLDLSCTFTAGNAPTSCEASASAWKAAAARSIRTHSALPWGAERARSKGLSSRRSAVCAAARRRSIRRASDGSRACTSPSSPAP